MFQELFEKLNSFASHHQAAFAGLVTICLICISWGIENLLELYLMPHKPVHAYCIAIAGGMLVLWLVQHYILHAV